MTMMRWDPFREMMSLRQAMDRLFEDSFVRRPHWWPALAEGALPLSLEMYQTANDMVVKTAVPGAKPEEVRHLHHRRYPHHQGGAQGGERGQRGGLFPQGTCLRLL